MANLTHEDATANGNGDLTIINGTADADNIDISGDTQGLSFEISASGGDDTVIATTDAGHKIFGDDGNDTITTGDGVDDIRTGAGNDIVVSGNGELDIIVTGEGDDQITGGDDFDLIDAGDGDDIINAGLGRDDITPGKGDDTIDGGDGGETFSGDVLRYKYSTDEIQSISYDGTTLIVTTDHGTDTATNIETVRFDQEATSIFITTEDLFFGTDGADNLTGDDDGNRDAFFTGDGDDIVATGAGGDKVFTGRGDDEITQGSGNDEIFGGQGDDTVKMGVAKSDVTAITFDDTKNQVTITSSNGVDLIGDVENFVFTDGITETSILYADLATELAATAAFTILGTTGNDDGVDNPVIVGTAADDTIDPKGGSDDIDGGAGDDTVQLDFDTTDVTDYLNTNGVVTLSTADDTITIRNVENYSFNGTVIALANLEQAFVSDQTFNGTSGNDSAVGGSGNDTFVAGFATGDIVSIAKSGDTFTINGGAGNDSLTNIENLQLQDRTILTDNVVVGTNAAETLNGTALLDIIDAGAGNDTVNAGAGDDFIFGVDGGDTVDGGDGRDFARLDFNASDITSARVNGAGSYTITTAAGSTTLNNIESASLNGADARSVGYFVVNENGGPSFTTLSGGQVTPEAYVGPVTYLEYQLFGNAENDVMTGDETNDFINLFEGDDAAVGGAGDDILDGGLGSNFLTGGIGADQFYIDGRGAAPGAPSTWSTITDFSVAQGDTVNVWGWIDGTSQLLSTKVAGEVGSGATGFEGFTHHYDFDGDGGIDTSITFTGLAASPATNEAREIAGLGYQFYGA